MTDASLQDSPKQDPNEERTSKRQELPCIHCGLATIVPANSAAETVFCCNGCRQAYDMIHGWGLENYYALRDQNLGDARTPSKSGLDRYQSFDDPDFLGHSAPKMMEDGSCWTELSVSGLHCAACAWLIENVATRTSGWRMARVRLNRHTVRLVFDPQKVALPQIAHLVGSLGYELSPLTGESDDRFHLENRRLLMQIAVAGFCAANAMWIAIALYAGDSSGLANEHRWLLRIAGTILGIATVVIPGRTFFVSALASLRMRTPHMDLPVALGLSVGTIVGLVSAVTGRGDVYFDSLAMLVFLLLVGRWIQFRQQHRAASAVDLLMRITPQHATLVSNENTERTVLVESLKAGQTVRVASGESIPVDGQIIHGESVLDRSLLTGESVPAAAGPGDPVTAGTVNLTRPIDICVQATGSESRMGKVMQAVEAATAQRTPIVQLADRIGGIFVVVVTLLAVGTFAFWLRSGISVATANATALLIVACPCALALATPLGLAVTLGRAAKRRILIRDGGVLSLLSKRGVIWFDKTGTLTEGRPRAELIDGDIESLRLAAGIEQAFCHPIAEAILRETEQLRLPLPETPEAVELQRGGVTGQLEGHQVDVGNQTFIESRSIPIPFESAQAVQGCLDSDTSPILIAIDGVATAVLSLSDPIKRDAQNTIQRLRSAGWKVGVLSGDHPHVVSKTSERIGFEPSMVFGGLSPEQKLETVTRSNDLTVVMIGDGANDAAALAAADVGIAVRGGAEVSLQAAPVFVASGGLSVIADLVDASRRCQKLIMTTFAVSLAYNGFAVILALTGYISPLLAAVLMPISSVSVLSLTLAWPTFLNSDPSSKAST